MKSAASRKKRFERGTELRARRRRSSLPRSKRFLREKSVARADLDCPQWPVKMFLAIDLQQVDDHNP